MWSHVTAWSKGYVTLWLDMWLLIISNPSIKFDSHRSREDEFVTFICFMSLRDHVINRLCGFVDNRLVLEPTTRSTLVAIGLAEVEIYRFYQHVITWSGAQSAKRHNGWRSFTVNLYLVKFGSHRPRGSGDISFFIYHVISCGHVIIESHNFADCRPSA